MDINCLINPASLNDVVWFYELIWGTCKELSITPDIKLLKEELVDEIEFVWFSAEKTLLIFS